MITFLRKGVVGSLVSVIISLPLSLEAQTNAGILAGSVLDQSGGAIEGVQVTVKNEGTGTTLTATTGPEGTFRFASLLVGNYDVTASHPGFTSATQTGL